ncbi:glutamic acid-rich protein-like [Asparagus officinalis]|uniref:glutamic acid-rich protein-like n=1 Tax=Asparagus officinalis TaxID=4686 RepID=UPI00098E5001|nr:glutamic acid-rich protein-like [Asparagus officinalis]
MVVSLPRKKEKIEKVKDEKQARVKGRPNSSSVGYKLLHATKHGKRLQWDVCSKEIHRLNRKLEFYEGTADPVDPEDLKKNVEVIISKSDRHTRDAHVKRKSSIDSIDKGDNVDCFNYHDVCVIGKKASHIAEDVAQAEQEVDKVDQDKDEEKGGEDKEEEMEEREQEKKEEDKEEDEKEEDREKELFEEDREQENKEEDTEASEKDEDREEYFEEEDREQEMKVDEKEEER